MNNLDREALERTTERFKADPAKARETRKVIGRWVLEQGAPQFQAEIPFETGVVSLEADQPTRRGGSGARPTPLDYWLFGLVACYTSAFVTVATLRGIKLEALSTEIEIDRNLAWVFDLAEEPLIEEIHLILRVATEASSKALKEIEALAMQRCPAVYALRHPMEIVVHTIKQSGEEDQ
ncbi:MAG: OsmC family protein [Candidatus Bipolaricaulia bacterium]